MNRRYDIDWLRVFALGLLIVYHISIVFQPWSYFIYFPQSEKPLESIWLVMGLINIWRIPLLFIISGMGVYLGMRRRNWKELLKDRIIRILELLNKIMSLIIGKVNERWLTLKEFSE